MDRRAVIAALVALPLLLILPAGCGSQEGSAPGTAEAPLGNRQAGSVQELTLRIEGMT